MDKADYMQISTIFRRGLKEISKDALLLEAMIAGLIKSRKCRSK